MTTLKTCPAFQIYARDVLADARFVLMSQASRGVFMTLLLHAWLEGSIPSDVRQIAALLRSPLREVQRLWPEVMVMFEDRGDGRLVFPSQEEQRAEQAAWREKSRAGGLKSGESRRMKGGSSLVQPDEAKGGSSVVSPMVEANANTAYCVLHPASSVLQEEERQSVSSERAHGKNEHAAHAWCGRVCVPRFLHNEFVRALNREDADARLLEFYPRWLETFEAEPVTEQPAKFWRAAYEKAAGYLTRAA
jgi:hypothetical protein